MRGDMNMKNDIYYILDMTVPHLLFSDELKRVGIKSGSDFLAPVAVDCVKTAIKQQIHDCNLSCDAYDEILLELHNRGLDIQLEPGFFPDPSVLPHTFSKGVVKLLAEQQRAYNCASWYLMYFLVEGQAQELPTTKASPGYPYNLIKAVHDEVDRADKHPDFIPPEEIEALLCTLHPFEEDLLLILFKRGLTVADVLDTMALPSTDVVRWGFEEIFGRIKRNALCRLQYNFVHGM